MRLVLHRRSFQIQFPLASYSDQTGLVAGLSAPQHRQPDGPPAPLEQRNTGVAVQPRREPHPGGAAIEQLSRDGLRHHPAFRCDLMQSKVFEPVIDQQSLMSVLDLLTSPGVNQIDDRSLLFKCCRNQHILSAPLRRDRLGHEVLSGLRPVSFDVASPGLQVGPKIRQHLAQRRHLKLGQIQCAEALIDVIEAVAETRTTSTA